MRIGGVAAGAVVAVLASSCVPFADDEQVVSTAPALSAAEAAPGHVVTVTHDAIRAGTTVPAQVRIGELRVDLGLPARADGWVELVVPPAVDVDVGTLTAADATVSVLGGPGAPLRITAPPAVDGEPGAVVRAVLARTIADLTAADALLPGLTDTLGIDTSALRSRSGAVAADLAAAVAQLDETGTLPLVGGPTGRADLDATQLAEADRLLTSMLTGQLEHLQRLDAVPFGDDAAGPLRSSAGRAVAPRQESAEWLIEQVRSLRARIRSGASALVGTAGAAATAYAAYLQLSGAATGATGAGALAGFGSAALIAFLGAAATTVIVGSAAEGLAALEAFLDGGDYEFGNELEHTILTAFVSAGLALGAEVNTLVNLGAFLGGAESVRRDLRDLLCRGEPDERYRWLCEPAGPDPTASSRALELIRIRLTPELLRPGDTTTVLLYARARSTVDLTFIVDWGDGTAPTRLATRAGYVSLPHRYDTPAEQPYRIEVVVTSSDGDRAVEGGWVLVTEPTDPTLTVTGLPDRLLALDRHTWTFAVAGGTPPYEAVVDWGDDSPYESVPLAAAGPLALTHGYDEAGTYAITVDLVDAGGRSGAATASAEVREPVAITGIDGPGALDPGEAGTWTVGISGGWGPYELLVDWGDGTDPYEAPTDGPATVTHAYGEEDTFTVTAVVTDATGLSAEAVRQVAVPRQPITFSTTASGQCALGAESQPYGGPLTGTIDPRSSSIRLVAGRVGAELTFTYAADGMFTGTGTSQFGTWRASGRVVVDGGSSSGEIAGHEDLQVGDERVVCDWTASW